MVIELQGKLRPGGVGGGDGGVVERGVWGVVRPAVFFQQMDMGSLTCGVFVLCPGAILTRTTHVGPFSALRGSGR